MRQRETRLLVDRPFQKITRAQIIECSKLRQSFRIQSRRFDIGGKGTCRPSSFCRRDAADTQPCAQIGASTGYEVEQLRLCPRLRNRSDGDARFGVLNAKVKTNGIARLLARPQVRAQNHEISAEILT